MTRAGTGEAQQLPPLRAVLDAATIALELVLIAVIFFGLTSAALLVPVLNPAGTPLWPATGIALGVIMLRGYRVAPAIFAGSFVAHVVASGALDIRPVVDAGAAALGTTLAALVGAWVLERWSHGRKTFATTRSIGRFALVCFGPVAVVSSAVAMIGTIVGTMASKLVAGEAGLADAFANWPALLSSYDTWWLADAGGSLVVTPVIVLWGTAPAFGEIANTTGASKIAAIKAAVKSGVGPSVAETAVILLAAAVIGVLAFSPLTPALGGALDTLMPYRGLLGFLIVVPLLAAALRGNQRDAATAALIFCCIAGVSAGFGASADLANSLVLLLALAVATSLAPLVIGATILGHRDIETRLLLGQEQLHRRVEQTQLAFKNAKRHFQILIEGVIDYAIFLLDRSGRVASWNSGAQTHHRLQRRRNHRQAFRHVLPAGRAPRGRAEPRARTGGPERQARGRGLAHQKERHAVLHHRHDQRDPRRRRQSDRAVPICCATPPSGAMPRRSWSRRASSSPWRRKWRRSAN